MDGVAALDMGMDMMELGFTLAEHNPIILKQFGLINQAAVALTFRAAKVDDQSVEAYIIQARGMYTSLALGDVTNGEKSPLEATVALRYFRMEMGAEEIMEIDIDNMVRTVDGVDQMEQQRRALGI